MWSTKLWMARVRSLTDRGDASLLPIRAVGISRWVREDGCGSDVLGSGIVSSSSVGDGEGEKKRVCSAMTAI